MKPIVSVIVPVFRVEAYLPACVDSILGQSYRDIELILVDDGSDDGCPALCDAYAAADARVKCIHKRNGGLSDARNVGRSMATGAYIMYVDSDDWLDADVIRRAVELAQAHSLDVVLWSYISEYGQHSFARELFPEEDRVFDHQESRQICRRIIGPLSDDLTDPQKVFSFDTAWGKLYRREVTEGISFVSTKEIGTEDALYNIYVFSGVQRIGYVSGVYLHYRKTNTSSLTASYKANLVELWGRLYDRMQAFLDETDAGADAQQALQNRIGLSMLGVGMNEVRNPAGWRSQSRRLREVLREARWREAVRQLDISRFPLKWKVFYRLCKWHCTTTLTILLHLMMRMRERQAS